MGRRNQSAAEKTKAMERSVRTSNVPTKIGSHARAHIKQLTKHNSRRTDGTLPADLMRSLRPVIRHYSPPLLLADALKKLAAKEEYDEKKAARA